MPDLTFLCGTPFDIGQDRSAGRAGPEIWTAERCFIRELLNDPETPEASLAVARVPSGEITVLHCLVGVTERYLIQSGIGRVEVDGVKTEVGPGDVVLVPAGASQRIANLGRRDVVFFCLCTPRFRPECYRVLED
jgi:mannose-6-phosphate isomerase-like protein (cupin superfamily)